MATTTGTPARPPGTSAATWQAYLAWLQKNGLTDTNQNRQAFLKQYNPFTPGQGFTPLPGLNLDPGGVFGAIGNAVSDVASFLQLIGWIFHPRNLLRAVEFITGIALMVFGLNVALRARGTGFTGDSVISQSGLGRVSRQLAQRRVAEPKPKKARSYRDVRDPGERPKTQSASGRTHRKAPPLRQRRAQHA